MFGYLPYIIIIHDILYLGRRRLLFEALAPLYSSTFTISNNHDDYQTEINTGNKAFRFGVHGGKRGAWSKRKDTGCSGVCFIEPRPYESGFVVTSAQGDRDRGSI